ncbi:hypothetical protein JD844_015278 [Phrynosoma platyrhinos]|uniref:TTC28 C-terminal domain-containing protein n=1 Tax=Phrynosoma platyrhinos TaxID=52577 RepID=A0ABQ7T7P4_PHRPL|nr:hypothetical protein JD844_015278 [Phrynosoma platyrhinos]
MGSLQQALVCFEKRLVVAHELGESSDKAQAYGELGNLHSQLGNYEQAISCLERQLGIAREMKDQALEGSAACGLGGVYQQMAEYDTALQYHQLDLQIAEETNNPACQGRAYGNLGLTYESLGTYERAVVYQEQHLSIAAQMNDLVAKTASYSSLGRTHHALQNYSQAVMYLQEGFTLIGSDVKLNSPSSLIGQALTDILQHPDRARDALRVEKSLQRIHSGQHNSMYTSQQSVENKVGGIPGWQALLTAVGFRLDPPASGLPAAVFFPTSDPGDRLQQCSTTIQSLLGLPSAALQALCKLIAASETGEQLISRKEQDFSLAPIQVSISVQLWRLPGCHEFLAALVGQEEVILKTGKQASRRTMHFALQTLLALFDSTELPKRLSLDSSSSLESLASAQSVSNPGPLSYQNPPFSPTCPDSLASDTISVYSLSSIASSVSFASKPEGLADSRSRQDSTERPKNIFPAQQQRPCAAHGPFSPQTGAALDKEEDEEDEGFSVLSNEPLATYRRRFSPEHRPIRARGAVAAGSPNSPAKKTTLIPSPNSPFQKVGRLAGSDAGESDHSSTETDSTVKSQEEREESGRNPKLDPQMLAQKILAETQTHLLAVEQFQRTGGGSGGLLSRSSSLDAGSATPGGASSFRSSETSAFSRPLCSAAYKGVPSPPKPKPPARSSSLQKVSSGYNSPTASEAKEGTGRHSGQPSPVFRLKYPSSPYSTHISKSPQNTSPSSGHHSPAGSTPSPALSYSSASSARSSPADAPKTGAVDEKVQAVHNLKMFWQSGPQHSTGPTSRAPRSTSGARGASRRDVLSLLNLSPRHGREEEAAGDRLELKDFSAPLPLGSLGRNPLNGHWRPASSTSPLAPTPPSPVVPGSTHPPVRLPSGNGYKFLSPGRFFPSSKC